MAGSTPASATGDAGAGSAAVRPPQLDEGARSVLGLAAHRTAGMAGAPIGLVGRPIVSPTAEAWRRFRRHKMAVVSLVVLGLMVLLVLLGPSLWKVAINDIDFSARLQQPSMAHPLGTDDLGQDLLARMMYGGRISLAVGMAAMMMSICVGVAIGSIAGISRGSIDAALMWLIYLFLERLKAVFGPEVGVFILIVVVIGAFRWMPVARLVRAQFFSLREKEFVEAARALGAST